MMLDVVCVTYHRAWHLPTLVHSFLVQDDDRWNLRIIHDGPADPATRRFIDSLELEKTTYHGRQRIVFQETGQRFNDWGHSLRDLSISDLTGDYVLFTNDDNYYMPTFVKHMLFAAEKQQRPTLVYCDMLHNFPWPPWGDFAYAPPPTELKFAGIDCGAVICRVDCVKQVGWKDKSQASDWTFVHSLMKTPDFRYAKVAKLLFVHN